MLLCLLLSAAFAVTFATSTFAATDNERAEAFIAAVEAISDAATLSDKKACADYAKSDGIYFTDTSFEGVAEALEELEEKASAIDEAIAVSQAFVENVSLAVSEYYGDGSYLIVRAALDAAKDSYYTADSTWQGVLSARESYSTINTELAPGEATSKSFVNQVTSCITAINDGGDVYKTVLESFNNAKGNEKEIIAEYPGVSEAVELLSEIEEYLQNAEATANEFIAAVSLVGTGNPYERIPAAYAILKNTDKTVKGVSAAIKTLEGKVAAINTVIELANSAQAEIVKVAALGAAAQIDTARVAVLPTKKEI